MNDNQTTIQQLKDKIKNFMQERDWQQFHTPKNLSMNISVEAAELMEKFLWVDSQKSFETVNEIKKEIEDEVADVFISIITFCNMTNIDLNKALVNKLEDIAKKYPIEKCKGKSAKYTKY